jgi:hypothetical protein
MPSALRNQAIIVHQTVQQVAGLPKTGQTTEYQLGDDGTYEMGNPVSPRFTNNGNGTITDNATGLMWAQDPSLCGGGTYPNDWASEIDTPNPMAWANAITNCEELSYAGHSDWRLPNIKELFCLLGLENCLPTLPSGHPFLNIQLNKYWSSTTHGLFTDHALIVDVGYGLVNLYGKADATYVWPVRGGVS